MAFIFLQFGNQTGELISQFAAGDTFTVFSFQFRSEVAAQSSKAAAPVLFGLCTFTEGGLSFLLTTLNGSLNVAEFTHAGRVCVFCFVKCGQRTGNTLFRAFILFTDNGLHGFDNEFGFHVQALRVFNLK